MMDDELDAIEARAKAATPGPWIWEDWTQDDGPNEYTLTAPPESDPDWSPKAMFPDLRNKILNDEDCSVSQEDRDFIAHAREDIPRLVAELRAIRKAHADAWAQTQETIRNTA